ncbi:MAG: anaerobic ribonucleoside-triphosphate reductase activating protein [Lachnospiraceae bacterium]|nr:anaerobic ribonucleoside-triphosphate reductase activating protein [Lachnospiraceae bacterium]
MNYGKIFYNDVANGVGCRTSLFVSGCTHHCKGCFNPETWSFSYGDKFTRETEDRIIKSLKPVWIDGLTVLGGEPMEPENQAVLCPFLERVKKEVPKSTIWIYSGYTWEELNDPSEERCFTADTRTILSLTDVLVDGEYIEKKRDVRLPFRGSSNQRIIDVPKSLKTGSAITRVFSP